MREFRMFKPRMIALAAALMVLPTLALMAPATGQQKITIGVSLAQDDNPFYIAMLRGIRARAEELGWDVATVSANEDKLKQINGVQDLIARGVKGKVALLMGPSGAPTFRNLGDGYSEVMAEHPGIEIVSRADGPLTRERGVKQGEDVLVAHPDLAAIYAANDDVALGAMQAVNASNRKGKTLVTGMNGVPPALRAVKEENLAMTVELNPTEWGRLGVDVLAAFLKGDKVEPRVFIKHVIIDGGNIDAKLPKT